MNRNLIALRACVWLGFAQQAPPTQCKAALSLLPLVAAPPLKYSSQSPMLTKRMPNMPGATDRRMDALLTLLSENSTIVISGEKIAKEIGVTRQQVWRWVQKMRELGVKVKGHTRSGYHIERAPDILAPQLLSHRLFGTPFARRIHHYFKSDSTNSVAM